MIVEVLHNVTRGADGRMAAWDPLREGPRCQAGDLLVRVGRLDVEAGTALAAAEAAFAAGNSPDARDQQVLAYRSWRVRSLSVGDVVVVRQGPDAEPVALGCEPTGWVPVDLSTLRVRGVLLGGRVARRVKALRERDPWMPIVEALRIARSEVDPDLFGYQFLADLYEGTPVVGTVGPFTVRVEVMYDEGYRLGDDDVSGWFTDIRQPGSIPNVKGSGSYQWYHPSKYTLEHTYQDLRAKGMSKSVARERYDAIVQREMAVDRERHAVGVVAAVSVDGRSLAEASLWGVEVVSDFDARPYLIEVAARTIDDAVGQAREKLPEAIAAAHGHVALLYAALGDAS